MSTADEINARMAEAVPAIRQIEITWSPIFWLDLTVEQVNLLMQMSAMHYDARCKQAGQVGGFLYGWSNQVRWRDEAMQAGPLMHGPWLCKAVADDLNTLMKIMEWAPVRLADIAMLHLAIGTAMRVAGVWK